MEAREVPDVGQPPGRGPAAAPTAPRTRDPATAVPGQEAFVAGHHGGAGLAGRDYKLFIPAGAGSGPLPLVVMLHGCTQDPDDFAAGTRMNELAQAEGFFVLYPAQAQRANPQRCWNWFKPNHQGRGRGEPELLAGMVRGLMARYPIDPDRVYVAGLSAGGAMAAIVAAAYPEIFAAAGVHSGLAAGAAHDVPSAFEAMKKGAQRPARAVPVPTIVFHGDADATVHPVNGRQVMAAAGPVGGTTAEPEELRPAGRRRATRQVQRDATGAVVAEHWLVHGAPHAWSGGSKRGSYTDPEGPDATAEMLRFFREHPRKGVATG
ncbi:esterase, Carbohydrate Esterase Family 1-like protein [Ramlibacter tataouinensis TTB310]|uniref:Esterase, Carbohydrate Esterase Family 1-like protein n=1 Tax=Ramlibacter tataouinensis (strain ATCC BAA-407 / DSM 14655 / LMG 21543 / TTB310) TaxID=365046 RepID=F5Y6H1_RAMTT|nr:esterase, Carbohydrate Esterase Family 1-like protein [Ramlibacter tataouinensis TTB310]